MYPPVYASVVETMLRDIFCFSFFKKNGEKMEKIRIEIPPKKRAFVIERAALFRRTALLLLLLRSSRRERARALCLIYLSVCSGEREKSVHLR